MTAALEVSCLAVRFGGVAALQDVSLTAREGELVGLIGPNGAGKTTFIDAVTGFARCEGTVCVAGRRVDGLRPDQRAVSGLGRTFQSLELFEDLTVRDNVSVSGRASLTTVDAMLAAMDLAGVADRLPTSLSPGHRRFVALARALATEPHVLLLDEIAAGLDIVERTTLATRLRDIVSTGTCVVLVEHDLAMVADVSDRVVVLDAGRVIATGPAQQVRHDERVLAAYLGRS